MFLLIYVTVNIKSVSL